jgi:hypothetical protein
MQGSLMEKSKELVVALVALGAATDAIGPDLGKTSETDAEKVANPYPGLAFRVRQNLR